jgi:hypothetical protein
VLEQRAAQQEARAAADKPTLQQSGSHIRAIEEYRDFFEQHAAQPSNDPKTHTHRNAKETTR